MDVLNDGERRASVGQARRRSVEIDVFEEPNEMTSDEARPLR